MSEIRIPIGKYARRVFWSLVIGCCLLLVGIRFFVLPWLFASGSVDVEAALDQVVVDLLATVIAATVLGGAVVWLTRPSKKSTELRVVHPRDLRSLFEENLKGATSWMYSGSVGRWNRARVMPEMAAASRATNLSRSIIVNILDPRDADACAAYARYRSAVRTGRGEDWSVTRVRCDLLATIVKAAVLCDQNPLLDIRIALKRSSAILRVDVSDEQLVMTREDPSEPGLVCDRGSYFYDALCENIKFERSQAHLITLAPRDGDLANLTPEKTGRLLAELGLDCGGLSEQDLRSITEWALSDDHPYG